MMDDAPAPHSLEPQFRKLGLSTYLVKGVPTLKAPHTVCKPGDTLNPNQVNLLKLFGKQFATVSSQTRDLSNLCSKALTPLLKFRQFQIVPVLGINVADGTVVGGKEANSMEA